MSVMPPSRNWVRQVRRFVEPTNLERCGLCGKPVPEEHAHVVDIVERRLLCACAGCLRAAVTDGRYARLPTRVHRLTEVRLTESDWDGLQIPIGLAFIFHSSPLGRPIALYPGPAGATESLLGLDAWSEVIARNPVLATFAPDVEALLIDRTEGRRDYYRVPIDRCYALVGLLRRNWHGLSGGSEARAAIAEFFARLGQSADVSADWAHG